MHHLYLVLAIVAEVIATSALKASDGFRHLGPSGIVVVGYGIAFYFLAQTLRVYPIGVAYAIWSGLGIVLISLVGYFHFRQALDAPAILGLALIDLDVRRGEVVVIMGPSGSGKTTLIRCLNFLEEPDAGRVRVCGMEIPCGGKIKSRDRARQIREIRTRAAMVFQHFNLFPHMTALGNVIEGPVSVRGMAKAEAEG